MLAGYLSVTLLVRTTALLVLCALAWTGLVRIQPPTSAQTQSMTGPAIPVQTDDGQDPINLIFTGYAPSWWVASNMAGWSDTAYCSGPKTINGAQYNFTLQLPDPTGFPCIGPRDHIRIWDMGYSPTFGEWSVAAVHHEHTVCDPLCHHVIDSWSKAQADARSSLLGGQATASVSNYTLANRGYYQGVFNDGNATMIQLKPLSGHYPVVFTENGLGNQTAWSVTLNGSGLTSTRPVIVFDQPNGTYSFTVGVPAGFTGSPSSGTVTVNGGTASENIRFRTLWTTSTMTVGSGSRTVSIVFTSNATVASSSVQLSESGDTTLAFKATEIGPLGAINVTLLKSLMPVDASTVVYVDGARDNASIMSDSGNYYVYFLLLFGTHAVQIQLVRPATPYWEYFIGGALAVGTLGAAFITFKVRKRKPSSSVETARSKEAGKFHNA